MGIFYTTNRQKDRLGLDEFNSNQFPPLQPHERQTTSTAADNSIYSALVFVGAAFILVNILLVVVLLPGRPVLESAPMCGMTTGGEAECYFDCETVYNRRDPAARLIQNLDCLDNCFNDTLEEEKCIRNLLDDIKMNGVCDLSSNDDIDPGSDVYRTNSTACAQYSPNPLVPNIIIGTCSQETEDNLVKPECRQLILQQPGVILNTVTELINSGCTKSVSDQYLVKRVEYTNETCGCDPENYVNVTTPTPIPDYVDLPPFPWKRSKERQADQRFPNLRSDRTLPISLNINNTAVILTTTFDFRRTRNRYPWICSLRGTDLAGEHFCAVTLLSVPPKPTIVVGPAHCTYLCKNGKNRVPSCCCRTDTTKCSDDLAACGDDPEVVEMEGEDAQVLCGDWETGTTPMELSGERYNVILDVSKIIRHPNFDTNDGPIAGSDIAVFKVNDERIRNGKVNEYNLNPICLSPRKSKRDNEDMLRPFGIQAGWSEPPSFSFLNKYASAYSEFYRDFSKQWHYRMDIVNCTDPEESVFGPLKCPSNTSYPPATVCAKDFAKQACFSPGESGSPLMDEDDEEGRFSLLGILSFVKGRGCDIYSNNPSAYTKVSCFLPWIARQFGMKYELEGGPDTECSVGTPHTISTDETCLVKETRLAGEEEVKEKCQNIPSNLQEYLAGEQDCIFPFYYNGRKYEECILFTEAGFVYPAFRCPVHNITNKREGLNNFVIDIIQNASQTKDCPSFGCQIFQTPTYCAMDASDQFSDLNPKRTCNETDKRAPFSVCKNNCPGVSSLGVIGGGALLFAAAGLVGQGFLAPALGGVGLAGIGGMGLMMADQNCQSQNLQDCNASPCCRAASGQCCMLQFGTSGLVCPSRC